MRRGAWSRRITDAHRLVYRIQKDDLVILQARYHYPEIACRRRCARGPHDPSSGAGGQDAQPPPGMP